MARCTATASSCASSRFRKTAWKSSRGLCIRRCHRLEHQGLIESEWGESDNKRKAKYYRLTATGRRQLQESARSWNQMTDIIEGILNTQPEEI